MPVGTARMAYPRIIIIEAMIWPVTVWGAMSPYPTVVTVTIAQ